MGVAFAVSAMSPFSYNFSFIFFVDPVHGPGFAASSASWILSLGQLAELPLIPALGWLIAKMGLRWTVCSGIVAAAVRSLVLAWGEPVWLLVASQALNGYYIACFLVAGTMVVERLSPADLRASAQGLLVLCIRGLGLRRQRAGRGRARLADHFPGARMRIAGGRTVLLGLVQGAASGWRRR